MERPPSFDITFFVPCFNEEENIVGTIQTIEKALAARDLRYEVLVFDDGSSDGSVKVLSEYLASRPSLPVNLICNESNQGVGANYVRGAHVARGRNYMMVCGDNDTPLETLNFMLDQLGKADIIVPYLTNLGDRPWMRQVLSNTYTWLVGTITGSHLRYYNGIVIHLTSTIRQYPPKTSGFAYQAEILSQAAAAGVSILEVPHFTVPQAGAWQTSAFRVKNVISVGLSIWRMFWGRRYHSRRPRP